MLAVADEGKLYWVTETTTGVIPMPPVMLERINARRGLSKLAVGGRGLVLVYDFTHIAPTQLAERVPGGMFAVLDDDTLLHITNGGDWGLINLASGARTPIPFEWVGMPLIPVRTLAQEKRALVVFNEAKEHLFEVRDDPKPLRHIAIGAASPSRPDITMIDATLVPGDATVYSDGEGRLYATYDDTKPIELGQLDGAVHSIATLGKLRFAAVSENGELVRGTLDGTGTLERTHIAARDDVVIGADPSGNVLVGLDREMVIWDRDVHTLTKFDKVIAGFAPIRDHVLVEFGDRSMIEFDPVTLTHRELFHRGVIEMHLDPSGTLGVALLDSGHVAVVDLPDGEPMELAPAYGTAAHIGHTPTTRTLVVGESALDVWRLPHVDGDLASWIDEYTNARDNERGLDWPWKPTDAAPAAAAP